MSIEIGKVHKFRTEKGFFLISGVKVWGTSVGTPYTLAREMQQKKPATRHSVRDKASAGATAAQRH